MLSEKEIEALKDGAYGVTRSGRKARYIGENENGSPIIALFYENGTFDSTHIYATSLVFSEGIETHFDIVGLWKDKPEPFNLERALAGEPVLLENAYKAFVKFQLGAPVIGYYSLVGYFINERGREERCAWFNDGNRGDNLKIIGMWKEPEPVKPNADSLPKPIREFGYLETVWYVNKTKDHYAPYGVTKNGDWLSTQYTSLSRGCYYATEEDCRAVCNWLMNR